MSSNEWALAAEELTIRFGEVVALEHVTFRVPRGCLAALIGPNGAGKTTLLRATVGLVPPTSGSLRVLGRAPERERVALLRTASYVPDTPTFYEHLTAKEIFCFVARLRGLRDVEEAKWSELAPRLELVDAERTYGGALSLGQRKRLSLACALVHDPELLLLDEPLTGLDPAGVETVHALLRSRVEAGTSIFLSTHMFEIAERSDLVVWLDKGRLTAVGSPRELGAEGTGELRRQFLASSKAV